jgi:hypothetical protein
MDGQYSVMTQIPQVRERVHLEGYMTWLLMVAGNERRGLQRPPQARLHSDCEGASETM